MILISQQTNMFEAEAAIAKHAPQAIPNVQEILIFLAAKNKTNGGKKSKSMSPGTTPFFSLRTFRDHLGRVMNCNETPPLSVNVHACVIYIQKLKFIAFFAPQLTFYLQIEATIFFENSHRDHPDLYSCHSSVIKLTINEQKQKVHLLIDPDDAASGQRCMIISAVTTAVSFTFPVI